MKLFLFLMLCCLISCSTINHSANYLATKTFVSEKNGDRLIFGYDSFTLLTSDYSTEHSLGFDTISKGRWKIDNNFIVLNSDIKFGKKYFNVDVTETRSGSADSLYIKVENPIEGTYDIEGNVEPYVYYNVHFDGCLLFKNGKNRLVNNKIVIHYNKNETINSIFLLIYPDLDMYNTTVTNNILYTLNYKIRNPSNNTLNMEIKDFDYKSFFYRKIDEDYVKIIDDKTILWDRVYYTSN